MTRRIAKKITGHPWAYPQTVLRSAAWRLGWYRLGDRYSRAALRADRVLARRYEDDASRWLPGKGPPPSMYFTTTPKKNRR